MKKNKTVEKPKDDSKRVEKLFELGAHIGHKKNRLHPKAKKYVYKIVDGTSIIDLTQTVKQIDKAKEFLKNQSNSEKVLLTVATKRVANQFIIDISSEKNIPYVTSKWLPGLITNFQTIIKNVKKMNEMKQKKQNGEWEKFVKHERIALEKELNKLEKLYRGLAGLTKKPDILYIVDIKKEKNALNEAKSEGIPIVAIADTNCNPEEVEFPIVANDDKPGVVEFISKEVISAFN